MSPLRVILPPHCVILRTERTKNLKSVSGCLQILRVAQDDTKGSFVPLNDKKKPAKVEKIPQKLLCLSGFVAIFDQESRKLGRYCRVFI